MKAIGNVHVDLGLYAAARQQLQPTLDLSRRSLGPENPKTLDILARLGDAFALQGSFALARCEPVRGLHCT